MPFLYRVLPGWRAGWPDSGVASPARREEADVPLGQARHVLFRVAIDVRENERIRYPVSVAFGG